MNKKLRNRFSIIELELERGKRVPVGLQQFGVSLKSKSKTMSPLARLLQVIPHERPTTDDLSNLQEKAKNVQNNTTQMRKLKIKKRGRGREISP